MFWLADEWPNAPKKANVPERASIPPINEHWCSPFQGKTIEDVVAFMKSLPEDRDVDYHHFAVLGEDFAQRRMVTIYRIGDENLIGDELDAFPCSLAGQLCSRGFGRGQYTYT